MPEPAPQRGLSALLVAALSEIGLVTLWQSSPDVKLLCAQRFVRMFAYGGSTLILVSYLSALNISDDRIGLFMTFTLVGDAVISLILTFFADRMGRKAVLIFGSVLMAGSGVVFGSFEHYFILLPAAIFGVISPSGNEIGPFRAVEESTLVHLTPQARLPDIFAWYFLTGPAGTALGIITCGWVLTYLQETEGWEYVPACRVIFYTYAAIGVIKLALSIGLSKKVEFVAKEEAAPAPDRDAETEPLLGESQANGDSGDVPAKGNGKKSLFSSFGKELSILVITLFVLFGLDAFGSGLASLSWMTTFFKRKFDLSEGKLGSIFFTTSIIAAGSMLVASSIAKRIGNVKTMVFTHLPSAVCLALIPIPSALPLALTFLIIRACTQNMDVAPRGAFLAAVLPDDKRTAIVGAINVVETCGQSLGPLVTGFLAQNGMLGWAFVLAGASKAVYDTGLMVTFVGKEARRQKSGDGLEENGCEYGCENGHS